MFWSKVLGECTCKDCRYCVDVEKDSTMLDDEKHVVGERYHRWYCRRMESNKIPEELRAEIYGIYGRYFASASEYKEWLAEKGVALKDFERCELFDVLKR